jgi:hypothetical protein
VSGLFSDIAQIVQGLINSGNTDLAYQIMRDELERNKKLVNGLELPELQNAYAEQMGGNAFDSAQTDPATRAYQMQALERLGQEVQTKGLTAEDLASQNQALTAAGRFESGQRGAAEQRAASRGMGGAMSSQLSALQGQQSAVNQANSNAIDVAGQNRQRYMAALGQMGNQAGNVRGQDWAQAAARASAQNQINQFNTGMRWQAQQHNLNLPQQNFQNQVAKIGLQTHANTAVGNSWVDWARAQQGPTNQIGQGFGQFGDDGMAAMASYYGGGAGGGGGSGGGGGMDWMKMFGGGGGGSSGGGLSWT